MNNYYEILQVDPYVSTDELKDIIIDSQRKWLGRTNAPDLKRRQEAERMVEILEHAELTLLNDVKRKAYDRELENYSHESEDHEILDTSSLEVDELIVEAWSLLEKGRTADAIVVGKRATEKSSGNSDAWEVLARAHYMWNEYDDATYEYKKAIDIAPNNDVLYYDLSDVYLDNTRLSDEARLKNAEQMVQKALKIKPNEKAYLFRLAYIYRFKEKYDQAIEILKRVIDQHGKEPSLGNELALNYYCKCLSMLYAQVDEDGEKLYSFISRESAIQGLELLKEAKLYATDKNILERLQVFIELGEKALTNKFLFGRFVIYGCIPMVWLLIALSLGSFLNIVISGALLFGAWKLSNIPKWLDTKEIVTGKRDQERRSILAAIIAMRK